MKKVTQEQLDAAVDAVNDCYSALCDVQSKARDVSRAFRWSNYGRLAEDVEWCLQRAEQILVDLGDLLDRDADDDGDDESDDE